MDLWTIIKVVVRRWHVSFPILLAAAYAGYTVTSQVPSTYQVTGSIILFEPRGTPASNPYLSFSGSLVITANALARVLGSPEERREFASQNLREDYGIQTEESFPGIRIAVLGKDRDQVIRTGQRLVETIQQRLTTLEDQSDAPADQRIGVRVLDAPTSAIELPPAVARLAAMIGALGLACATSLALLLEAVARSRRNATGQTARGRRTAEDATAEAAPAEPAISEPHTGPASNPVPVATASPGTSKRHRLLSGPGRTRSMVGETARRGSQWR